MDMFIIPLIFIVGSIKIYNFQLQSYYKKEKCGKI